jgi:hypothetical protein
MSILLQPYANHHQAVADLIYQVAGDKPSAIAEIGVWEGDLSEGLRHVFSDTELFLVDPWAAGDDVKGHVIGARAGPMSPHQDAYEAAYSLVLTKFKDDPKAHILRMSSVKAAATLPDKSLAAAFIDGNHTREAVEEDILAWGPKVKHGGILLGHDFDSPAGVRAAVLHLLRGKYQFTGRAHGNVWFVVIQPGLTIGGLTL